jgi:hypothetical protein
VIVAHPELSAISFYRGLSRRDPVLPRKAIPAPLANAATLGGNL